MANDEEMALTALREARRVTAEKDAVCRELETLNAREEVTRVEVDQLRQNVYILSSKYSKMKARAWRARAHTRRARGLTLRRARARRTPTQSAAPRARARTLDPDLLAGECGRAASLRTRR